MLGDLHLGRPGARMACSIGSDEVARFVGRLLDAYELVVLNGDVFDLERGSIPLAHTREWRHMASRHGAVVEVLRHPRVMLLSGNHDDALRHELGALDALRVHTDAGQVHIEHGHRFDAPIKQWREFASVVTWASGRVSALGADPLLATMRRLDRALTGEGAELGPIERGALRWLALRPEVAVMCIGHTHRVGVWSASGRTLVNPGDGVRAPIGWLSVDGRNGLAELRRGEHERGRTVRFGA